VRRLSISLLIVVLLSTIGLGWALDQLFDGLVKTESDALQIYRDMGSDLIGSVDSQAELATIVSFWPDSNPIKLGLINSRELVLPAELEQQMNSGLPLVLESESEVTLFFSTAGSEQVLSLSPPKVASETPLRVVLTMLFYGGMISLILLWIYPLARRLLALGRTARAFGEGQLDKRVSTHRRSFLYGIESEFNAMARRIQSLIADNKMLASAVSHDLRTPLARLRFGIDLLDEAKDEQVRAEYQLRLSNDLTTMESLVDVLLEYARLDKQLSDMPKTATDLNALVSASVESLNDIEGKTIEWQQQGEQFVVQAHSRYATMLINNLLQNAINYGRRHVHVSLVRKRNSIVLSIEDDGPGIPGDQHEEILKPFVRGSPNQQKDTHKGYGMGLAIASRIAQWHDATFSISHSVTLGGAQFDIVFPIEPGASKSHSLKSEASKSVTGPGFDRSTKTKAEQ